MKRSVYYLWLAFMDIRRLWRSVNLHVLIVAGICLPILLLMALKRGHVEDLRKELLGSATGRMIVAYAPKGNFMTLEESDKLAEGISGIDVIIPDTQRVVDLSKNRDDKTFVAESVTLMATRKGDPILKDMRADVLESEEKAVVLSRTVAKRLKAQSGDTITLNVQRQRDGVTEKASAKLIVKAIFEPSDGKGNIGYLDYKVVNWIERYVRGYRVPQMNWPAFAVAARDEYGSYLNFSRVGKTLQQDDTHALTLRGYRIEGVKNDAMMTIYGLIDRVKVKELVVSEIHTDDSRNDPAQRLSTSPFHLASLTMAADVFIPWNTPHLQLIEDRKVFVVGLSAPSLTWFRKYFLESSLPCDYDSDTMSICLPFSGNHKKEVKLKLRNGEVVKLKVRQLPEGVTKKMKESGVREDIGIVPVTLAAHLDAYRHGRLDFDPHHNFFVPIPDETTYDQWRVFAKTIDHVPAVIDELGARKFAYRSQNARIREIHKQDDSLQLLVWIVAAGVFGFGVLTVVSVLLDSTNRKRGTIGILRVMGVSQRGVFLMVFVRAVIIGVLAGVLTGILGYGATVFLSWEPSGSEWWIDWKPVIHATFAMSDIVWVVFGGVLCCSIGSLWPAWMASRLDPFDAIVEGRFR